MKKLTTALKSAAVLAAAILTAAAAAACAKESPEKLTRYEIAARYDETAHTVQAEMTVDYVNRTESVLDEVCFHLYPAAFREGARFSPVTKEQILSAYPNGMSYGGIEITELRLSGEEIEPVIGGQDEDILTVPLPEGGELYPRDEARIDMKFTVTLPNVRHRLGYVDKQVNLGNWYPIACAFDGGNFVTDPYYAAGDPFYSDVADYSVTLDLPENLVAATSGAVSHTAGEAGRRIYSSEIGSARDYAAVIGEMRMLGTAKNGTLINYYYSSDTAPERSLTTAADAFSTFSDLYGTYPYESYSVVETPFLFGGMEYPSLVMVSPAQSDSLYTEAIVHETAHQWWYAVVGNDEVRNAWMDEGLAEFCTGVFFERNPGYGVDAKKRMADALSAHLIYFDSFKHSEAAGAMDRPLGDYSGQFEYAQNAYVKGELMFDSLRQLIGEETFNASLADYYEKNRFRNARPDDLIGSFERVSGRELKGFFDSWLTGKAGLFGGIVSEGICS